MVTTFQTDDGFPARIDRTRSQVEAVVIVDDGDSAEHWTRLRRWFDRESDVVLIHHASNRGIAAALNTGLDRAAKMGFTHAALLDDDTVPAPGMVVALMGMLDSEEGYGQAIVGTRHTSSAFEEARSEEPDRSREVPSVITAGSLMPLTVFRNVGPFREELFIDYVDHEYSLRARACGVRIVQCAGAGMEQRIGEAQDTRLGHLRSIHSPARTYYFFRNSLVVALEYGWRFPRFALWIGWQQLKTLVKIGLFLQPKAQYLRAVRRGWRDGIARQLGRIPEDALA